MSSIPLSDRERPESRDKLTWLGRVSFCLIINLFCRMPSASHAVHALCFRNRVRYTLRTLGRSGRLILIGVALGALVACGSSQPRLAEGQYRVARGDTLTKIARRNGQTVQSLMRMNNISNPNRIRVGQVLRVKGSAPAPTSGKTPVAGSSTVSPRPPVKGSSVAAPRTIKLVWPAQGSSRRGTTTATTQGVYISAAAGTPIKAAAGGKVVYAGSGLRGYGNLLIINHDANFLSVYAHNDRLLVKEGATVKQGQQIATMGNTDSAAVNLYFELRYNGKPVDAMRYLP